MYQDRKNFKQIFRSIILGGITFPKLNLLSALLVYIGFVGLGLAFTLVKYGVFSKIDLTPVFVIDKLIIIMSICAILMAIFLLFGYLGQRKIEKDLL